MAGLYKHREGPSTRLTQWAPVQYPFAMLDIPSAQILDKDRLIGGCVRLALTINSQRLQDEVAQLPPEFWARGAGRIGVHDPADAVFLRGYAPAEGEKPIEDRPALDHLPYARSIIEDLIQAPRLRCLLARLPPAGTIRAHKDLPPYFAKSLRLHIPVETNEQAYMVAAGYSYQMRPGEIWALNTSTLHAVWNAHPTLSRTHLICDFLPSPHLLQWLMLGDRGRGTLRSDVDKHLAEAQEAWLRNRSGRSVIA